MRNIISIFLVWVFSTGMITAQQKDSVIIKSIFDNALINSDVYANLDFLTNKIGGRLAGTPQSIAAVEFTKQVMQKLAIDTVYLQECIVARWERGREFAQISSQRFGNKEINICAIGNSIPTPEGGITAQLVEVQSFEELEQLGRKKIEGKIVFFNAAMNPKFFNTFEAYGETAKYRVFGASEAAKYGAVAVIVRSLTTSIDEFPHTGVMYYKPEAGKIPAVCVCTSHAELLHKWLKQDANILLWIESYSKTLDDVKSYNVIGEIRGSEYPDEIITVGGHLDSWDIDPGAHDDGAGCVQAIDVLRLFTALKIKPKRTIRAVMFMDEEMNQRGGKAYYDNAVRNNENHIFALEADMGGATPRGFTFDAEGEKLTKLLALKKYFTHYEIYKFMKGWGGVDIKFLKQSGTPIGGLITDWQRYFDYHHCANDTFDKINKRELQLGSAAMATLIFLIDKYGL